MTQDELKALRERIVDSIGVFEGTKEIAFDYHIENLRFALSLAKDLIDDTLEGRGMFSREATKEILFNTLAPSPNGEKPFGKDSTHDVYRIYKAAIAAAPKSRVQQTLDEMGD